jgi:two-component system NtrC family sensor kinase
VGQIEQVLMNLVVNARDAMPDGGTLIIATQRVYLNEEFATSLDPVNGNSVNGDAVHVGWHTALVVSDTGTGIDEVTKQRIYEPFFTTKPPGKGTGLGLSTVFGIVKQHHGHIVFTSELGRGTTFTVLVPLAVSSPQELQPVAIDGV